MEKELKLNQEQMAALQPYEQNLMAAREHYLRPAGREGNAIFHRIYKEVTGEEYTKTDSCGDCELRLQTILQAWYFNFTAEASQAAAATPKKAKKK